MRSNTEMSSEEESNTHVTRGVAAHELEGVLSDTEQFTHSGGATLHDDDVSPQLAFTRYLLSSQDVQTKER